MKSFNIIFASLLLACAGLSFVVPNNFDAMANANNSRLEISGQSVVENQQIQDDADTVSLEKLNELLNKKLIEPLTKCIEQKDPHLFMTKCYSRMYFDLAKTFKNRKLYTDRPIRGDLIFVDCTIERHWGQVSIDYNKKEITVRESYKTGYQPVKTYLNETCAFIEKNGVPH